MALRKASGLSQDDLVDIIKDIGQEIVDKAEEIAPKVTETRAIKIVGTIEAGCVPELKWTTYKCVVPRKWSRK